MLARSLGISKVEKVMRTIKSLTYMNSWITKRLTNKTTKLSPSYGSNQDTHGSEAEFSLQDPNYTMWRSITAENVEFEQKPTDQTSNIHSYYKERWVQEQKEGRLDVDPKETSTVPPSGAASIYRQLAKKQAPIQQRGPQIRPPKGYTMEENDSVPSQSFPGRKMTRVPDSGHFPRDNYQVYDKPKIEQTEPIGMPKSGAFTVTSFKIRPDEKEEINHCSQSTPSSSGSDKTADKTGGMSWEFPGEFENKRSSGTDEPNEATSFSPTDAPAPNFKSLSGL